MTLSDIGSIASIVGCILGVAGIALSVYFWKFPRTEK